MTDRDYHEFRSEEVGFSVPDRCYDVKFDREENFENETFYEPPPPGQSSKRYGFQFELAEALETIITLHHCIYRTKAYFTVAENDKLKRYYDRILQTALGDVMAKEDVAMYSKRDISALKKMTIAERKVEAMRQLKASFNRAAKEGTLSSRPAKV